MALILEVAVVEVLMQSALLLFPERQVMAALVRHQALLVLA
jgi:hypothetical protein